MVDARLAQLSQAERDARERVAVYAVAVAERLGWSDETLVAVRRAVLLDEPCAPEAGPLRELARRFDAADGDLNPEVLEEFAPEFPTEMVEALRAVAPLIQPIRDVDGG